MQMQPVTTHELLVSSPEFGVIGSAKFADR